MTKLYEDLKLKFAEQERKFLEAQIPRLIIKLLQGNELDILNDKFIDYLAVYMLKEYQYRRDACTPAYLRTIANTWQNNELREDFLSLVKPKSNHFGEVELLTTYNLENYISTLYDSYKRYIYYRDIQKVGLDSHFNFDEDLILNPQGVIREYISNTNEVMNRANVSNTNSYIYYIVSLWSCIMCHYALWNKIRELQGQNPGQGVLSRVIEYNNNYNKLTKEKLEILLTFISNLAGVKGRSWKPQRSEDDIPYKPIKFVTIDRFASLFDSLFLRYITEVAQYEDKELKYIYEIISYAYEMEYTLANPPYST